MNAGNLGLHKLQLVPHVQILRMSGAFKYQSIFAQFMTAGKPDLSKVFWNPKRKLVVTIHFSEKINDNNSNSCKIHNSVWQIEA